MRHGGSLPRQHANFRSLLEDIDRLYFMVERIANVNQPREGREDLPDPPQVPLQHDPEQPNMDLGCHRRLVKLNP